MFDWSHAMETAVERNNQTHPFMIFLFHLFYKIYIKTSQIMNKNVVKIKSKYKKWISFSDIHRSMKAMDPMQS